MARAIKRPLQSLFMLQNNPMLKSENRLKVGHKKENHPFWKGGFPKCLDCNKELSRRKAKRCRKCSNRNVFYIDGRSGIKYPFQFSKKLKEQIRKRDNYTCKNCKMTQEEHFIVYGRDIEIHHIDYDKKNCKNTNLITLCKQCNIRANYNRDYWMNLYKEIIKHE